MSSVDLRTADLAGQQAASERAIQPRRVFPVAARLMHWLIAAFVLMLVMTGVIMKQMLPGPLADNIYVLHKFSGALAFGLIVLRLGYRIMARLTGRWLRASGGQAVHRVLYGVMLLVPLLGWAGVSDYGARSLWFGLSLPAIWPEGAGYADMLFLAHACLAFGLLALVVIHIGIALDTYIHRNTNVR